MHRSIVVRLILIFFCGATAMQFGCDSPAEPKQLSKNSDQGLVESIQNQQDVEVPSDADPKTVDQAATVKARANDESTTQLFDGKSLDGWEVIEFGGEGDVEVVDGVIQMFSGDPLTGICVTEDVELPQANYEVSLEGMKLEGSDFFCAVTFPVNDSFCTLVVGGWGGSLVGLSNLDGRDASDNGTKVTRKFNRNQWYTVRIQVLPDRITAWIDDEKLIDESILDREVSIRNDVIATTPLGITNFITSSSLRDIKIRKLD